MASSKFHDKPFDEGTLTKLKLFQLYIREWLPVFLGSPTPRWGVFHLFDFFAGPGTDSKGVPGSPLRLLTELADCRDLPGWKLTRIEVHFFDKSRSNIQRLKENIQHITAQIEKVSLECEHWTFSKAFQASKFILEREDAAKLILIDQFGVDEVTDDVFRELAAAPACDLGMDKFLEVVWKQDQINGEADYDIGRENMLPGQQMLWNVKPSKLANFERDLEARLRSGQLHNEMDVMKVCFQHGVLRRHASSILTKLKKERIIDADFRVPDARRLKKPRSIRMLG